MTNTQLPPVLQQAMQASSAGDVDTAMRLLRAAIRDLPDDPLSHFLLAAELAQGGQIEEAEAAYANTVLLAPAFETARFQLGLLQFTSGRASIAMLTWQPLLELPDTNPFQRFVCGMAALATDQFEEATSHLREGIALNRDNAPLNVDMQKMLDRIAQHVGSAGPAAERSDEEPAQASHHVLLSNYRQDGPAH
jgi:Flp pilus assembly protein TadD